MKLSYTAFLLSLSSTLHSSTAKNGQCVSGEGEFIFRSHVDSHFMLSACMADDGEESSPYAATGEILAGQANKEGDVFHYDVHCMDVDGEDNTVYIGAEIGKVSEYVKTLNDPDLFNKALTEDMDIAMSYEKEVHEKMIKTKRDSYIPLLEPLLKKRGQTLEEYEEFLNNHKEGEGRKLDLADPFYIVPLVAVCAKSNVLQYRCDFPKETTAGLYPGMGKKEFDWANFNSSSVPIDAMDGIDFNDVDAMDGLSGDFLAYCWGVAGFICECGEYLQLLPGGSRRDLREKDHDNGSGGTMALFQLKMTEGEEARHTIAVKLGHDFDTSCADFRSSIDRDYFADDEVVDILHKGEVKLA